MTSPIEISFGEKIFVWTSTGWERFDWFAYDTVEEAYEFLSTCEVTRLVHHD